MNKRFLISNTKESINIGLLENKFKGKRVLVVDNPVNGLKELIDARAYFHVVIVNGYAAAQSFYKADIVFYKEDTPYIDGKLEFSNRVSGQTQLFCVNYKAVKLLSKINVGHQSYVLSCSFCDTPLVSTPGQDCLIGFGLNKIFPGQHLALIGKAESIYTIGRQAPVGTNLDLNSLIEFINVTERYIPINLVGLNRPPYIKKL